MCVVAGPGSGKTRVLVERFRWLVQRKGIQARRILAITFTEKAAANMRRRLVESFPAASAERKDVERAYISTIHAFCARLLRENAIEAAVDPEFRVLDEWEADFDLRHGIEETLEREYAAHPERVREFLRRFGPSDVPESLFGLYQALRAADVSVVEAGRIPRPGSSQQCWQRLLAAYDRLASLPSPAWNAGQAQALHEALRWRARATALPALFVGPEHLSALRQISINLNHFKRGSEQVELLREIRENLVPSCRAAVLLEENAEARQWLIERLVEADSRYRESKRQAGALDYADLEEGAIRLLEKTGHRAVASFDYLLMDEFQDTNPLQAKLAGLLRSPGNFFAVGDINQSIYGFRHADPQVFRDYRETTRERGGHVVELFENFRSRPEVLRAIQAIIAGAQGVEAQELKAEREFPPREGPFLEVFAVHAGDSDEALRWEAGHVAARIGQLCGALEIEAEPSARPARYGDFAILLRTTAQVRVFERVLRRRGIPCQVTEGRGFYETREINDLLSFLRVLINPCDEISLAAVLRSPLAGVSDETLLRLKLALGSQADGSLIDALGLTAGLPEDEALKLDRFRSLLDRYRRSRDYAPLDRLLARLLSETGYEAWLLEQPGAELAPGGAPSHMAANVRKLLALARRFHASGLTGIQGFVERVEALRRDEVREAEAEPPEQTADAVQLMTVHAAKGLEFPVVILPAINRGTRRDQDPVTFAPNIGVGMRWRDPATGKLEADAVARKIADERGASNREETHRLFYVAMTRAQERLILSASFGTQVSAGQWASPVGKNLDIDWKQIDNEARAVVLRGIPLRLFQTNQAPALPAAPPVEAAEAPETTWIERLPAEEQGDTAVAASAVTLFAACPRRYYLSRYLGFDFPSRDRKGAVTDQEDPPPEPDEMDSTEFGRHVHALLAGAVARPDAAPEALRLVENFESSPWGRRAAVAARIEREQDFLLALDGRLLRGQIDLWFEEGGEIVLVDYKTDDVKAGEVAARAAEHELQLRLYGLAIERIAGARPHRALLYFLRPNVAVDVAVGPPALADAAAKVEELFQAQSALSFPLRVGEHCFRCPHFRGICPAQYPVSQPRVRAVASE